MRVEAKQLIAAIEGEMARREPNPWQQFGGGTADVPGLGRLNYTSGAAQTANYSNAAAIAASAGLTPK